MDDNPGTVHVISGDTRFGGHRPGYLPSHIHIQQFPPGHGHPQSLQIANQARPLQPHSPGVPPYVQNHPQTQAQASNQAQPLKRPPQQNYNPIQPQTQTNNQFCSDSQAQNGTQAQAQAQTNGYPLLNGQRFFCEGADQNPPKHHTHKVLQKIPCNCEPQNEGPDSLRFKCYHQVHDLITAPRWFPPEGGIPRSERSVGIHVRALAKAMKHVEYGPRKMGEPDQSYHNYIILSGHYDDKMIEICAWRIMQLIKCLHSKGFQPLDILDDFARVSIDSTKNLTFKERFELIRHTLKKSKVITVEAIRGHDLRAIVLCPAMPYIVISTRLEQGVITPKAHQIPCIIRAPPVTPPNIQPEPNFPQIVKKAPGYQVPPDNRGSPEERTLANTENRNKIRHRRMVSTINRPSKLRSKANRRRVTREDLLAAEALLDMWSSSRMNHSVFRPVSPAAPRQGQSDDFEYGIGDWVTEDHGVRGMHPPPGPFHRASLPYKPARHLEPKDDCDCDNIGVENLVITPANEPGSGCASNFNTNPVYIVTDSTKDENLTTNLRFRDIHDLIEAAAAAGYPATRDSAEAMAILQDSRQIPRWNQAYMPGSSVLDY